MLCEMCGKFTLVTSRFRIVGAVRLVCTLCARFGEPLDPAPPPAVGRRVVGRSLPSAPVVRPLGGGRRLEERDLYTDIGELELAPDWGKKVRIAREARTWTPEELAKRLNEKKSVVLKIESGGFHPPDALVRKLERLLQVRLRADVEPTSSPER